jgi:inner membrane transporter RhtA
MSTAAPTSAPPAAAAAPGGVSVTSMAMLCGSMLSVQFGAAIASGLFDRVGAPGTVLLRQAISASLLWAVVRPSISGRSAQDWLVTVMFGASLAAMNLCLYAALDRLPLGMAVTIELLGPLGLAVALSRRASDLAWAACAVIGVVLLSEGGGTVDPVGVLFALGAASCWAAYILLSASAGRRSKGVDGLVMAMAVGAVLTTPLGVASGGTELMSPAVLGIGAGVAVLSAVVPYSLEITALRTVPPRVFGVLMSLSPVVASLAGLLVLDEHLDRLQVVAIGVVVVASMGCVAASRSRVTR